MSIKVLLPKTVELHVTPRDDVQFDSYAATEPIPAEHEDAGVLVAWGISDAVLVNAARRPHTLVRARIGHPWASAISGPQLEPSLGQFSTLRSARILIWGFGSIATGLAPHRVALGATVTDFATTAREQQAFRVISTDQLSSKRPDTDGLIMIPPSTDGTDKILDAAKLAQLPRHAWVVNVGRGSAIDEDALLDALRANRIGGGALDLTARELLSADSPLWDTPSLTITPHAAGGRPLEASRLIDESLEALIDGRELRNPVERAGAEPRDATGARS